MTGDQTAADELAPLAPGVGAAVVKRPVTRFAAEPPRPGAARDLARREAKAAVERPAGASPPRVDLPAGLTAVLLCRGFPEHAVAGPR